MSFLASLSDAVWSPWLLSVFLAVGAYYSLRTGFFQLFGIRVWWRATIGRLFGRKNHVKGRGITQFQALSTALAATIGTGSIAGVATAIFFGGPGAVFWMWVSAFLGMMTSFAEKTLAVKYRRSDGEKGWKGGPMEYLRDGAHCPVLAAVYALFCVVETLVGGNLVQVNSIASALSSCLGVSRLTVGIATAAAAGVVLLGGIGRVGRVSERLVPLMSLLFLGGGMVVLARHASALPGVFSEIFARAFEPRAAAGGYSIVTAMRFGIARGVFTNEAGLGTSAIAHAAADVEEPAQEGMWGIFEVFVSTVLICSMTALVILSSGVYSSGRALAMLRSGDVPDGAVGAPLTMAAFGTVWGKAGGALVSFCLVLFAFTSILGAGFYGRRALESLTDVRAALPLYHGAFFAAVVLGSVGELTAVWQLVDLFNGFLAVPNLIGLMILAPEAARCLDGYLKKDRRGGP